MCTGAARACTPEPGVLRAGGQLRVVLFCGGGTLLQKGRLPHTPTPQNSYCIVPCRQCLSILKCPGGCVQSPAESTSTPRTCVAEHRITHGRVLRSRVCISEARRETVPSAVTLFQRVSGLLWHGLAWFGRAWSGMVWHGLAEPGLASSGRAWSGLASSGLAWSGRAWSGLAWHGRSLLPVGKRLFTHMASRSGGKIRRQNLPLAPSVADFWRFLRGGLCRSPAVLLLSKKQYADLLA